MLKSPSNDAASLRGKLSVRCTAWRAWRKNTLLGFASIQIAELDLTIYDVAVHAKNDRAWAQLPGRPWVEDDRSSAATTARSNIARSLNSAAKRCASAVIDVVVRTTRTPGNAGGGDMTRISEREAARAAVVLDEAKKLGIMVGAARDGSEHTIITPPGLGPGVGMSFSRAINDLREAVIDHILRESGARQ